MVEKAIAERVRNREMIIVKRVGEWRRRKRESGGFI